jgi:hypothetical protein
VPNRHARRRQAAQQRRTAKVQAKAKPVQVKSRLALTAAATVVAAVGDAPRTFNIVAYTGEPMRLWGFEYPVVVDLATLDVAAQAIPVLYDHWADSHSIVGQSDSVQVVNGQIIVAGRFILTPDEDSRMARLVLAKADAGYQWQASVGGEPANVERVPSGQSVTVNGRAFAGPVCVARGLQLREVSFVVLGGDGRTSAVVARSVEGSAMTFEEWLVSLGFTDAATLDEVQRANLQLIYNAEIAEEPEPEPAPTPTPAPTNAAARRLPVQARRSPATDPAQAARNQVADELERHATIRRLTASYGVTEIDVGEGTARQRVSVEAHAIRNNWDARQTELELLRASRSAPAIISRDHDRDCTLQALSGAMILRAGGRLDHPSYGTQHAVAIGVPDWLRAGLNDAQRNQYMEAAHRYSDMSMLDLCRQACRLDGRNDPINRSECIQAAFSGGSLSNIFTTNINTQVLATFMEAGDTTQGWTREVDVADFKTQERPRVTKASGLTKLPKGGTADHMNRGDVGESYKIARYAQMMQVDEQDIINDAFNALADTPIEMGMAAARLRPDLVYALLLANPTLAQTARALFNATDGNLKTGSALADATLKAAITAIKLFRENGVNLNLMPTHLIVPPTLLYTGRELLNSTTIVIAGTAGSVTTRGTANTLLGDIAQLVSDSRLENGVTDPDSGTTYSGSSSTWFLASNMVPTIEVAYLRGTGRTPQIRSYQLEKGKWGLGWDVNLDIGVKALAWQGLLEATA